MPSRYKFNVCLHALPGNATDGPVVHAGGHDLRTLDIAENPAGFSVTFDNACSMLNELPRMYLEPDGSFVWTGKQQQTLWQIEGVLYDEGERLAYVNTHGECPPDEFDQFLAAFGWPAAPIVFQLVDAGVFVSESRFRQHASRQQ